MLILVLATLTLVLAAAIVIAVQIDRGDGPRLELTPSLIFYFAFVAYALAMPFSRLVLRTEETPDDLGYMQEIVVVAIAMTVGAVAAVGFGQYSRPGIRDPAAPSGTVMSWSLTAVMAWAALFVCLIKWLSEVGFAYDRLFAAYGAEGKTYDEATMSDSAVTLVAIAANWVAVNCAIERAAKTVQKLLLISPSLLISIFFLLRGNRNLVIIQVLPLAILYLRGRRLRLIALSFTAVLAYAGLYLVGVIRQVGFESIVGVQVESSAFDPTHGELGTLFSVYEKVGSLPAGQLLLGRSYLIDSLTNLVPRQLWVDRPLTAAQSASLAYYGGGQLTAGIGYSPIIEARMNFGRFGFPIVFILLPVLIAILERAFDNASGADPIYYGAMTPMLVNFWRIDFATTLKMSLLLAVTLSVCARLVSRRQLCGASRHSPSM